MIATLLAASALAQPEARTAVYVELGGNALIYSLNVERRLGDTFAVSTGLGSAGLREPTTDSSFGWVLNPWRVHGLIGGRRHHLELALGVTWGLARGDLNQPGRPTNFWVVNGTSAIGYRYQSDDGGPVVRVAFTPHFGGERFAPLGAALQPWAGVSVGCAWGKRGS
ncbi:MAG: hypothetical protein AAF602_05235 [Myxococcota bacterium]